MSVDWGENKTFYEPRSRMAIPVNCDRITSVHIKIHDKDGKRIKFTGNDDNGVTCMLRLTRDRNG